MAREATFNGLFTRTKKTAPGLRLPAIRRLLLDRIAAALRDDFTETHDGLRALTPSETATGAVKLSVIPDHGRRSDFIAAARRAAQVASGGRDGTPALTEVAIVAPAGGIARLHVFIGATAAILIVLGLLQIVRTMISPSDETAGIRPSYTSVSPDALPEPIPGLASGPPTDAAPAADPLLAGSSTEAEATGTVRLTPGGTSEAAAASAESATSVKAAPSAVDTYLDLAMPGPAQ